MSYLAPTAVEKRARRFACPSCGSTGGTWCRTAYGSRSIQLHRPRLDLALEAMGVIVSPDSHEWLGHDR